MKQRILLLLSAFALLFAFSSCMMSEGASLEGSWGLVRMEVSYQGESEVEDFDPDDPSSYNDRVFVFSRLSGDSYSMFVYSWYGEDIWYQDNQATVTYKDDTLTVGEGEVYEVVSLTDNRLVLGMEIPMDGETIVHKYTFERLSYDFVPETPVDLLE